jgi:hypothetical protein
VIIEVKSKKQAASDPNFEELFLARLWLGKAELKDLSEVIDVEKHFSADLSECSFIFEGFKLLGQDFLEFVRNKFSLLRYKIFNKLG